MILKTVLLGSPKLWEILDFYRKQTVSTCAPKTGIYQRVLCKKAYSTNTFFNYQQAMIPSLFIFSFFSLVRLLCDIYN